MRKADQTSEGWQTRRREPSVRRMQKKEHTHQSEDVGTRNRCRGPSSASLRLSSSPTAHAAATRCALSERPAESQKESGRTLAAAAGARCCPLHSAHPASPPPAYFDAFPYRDAPRAPCSAHTRREGDRRRKGASSIGERNCNGRLRHGSLSHRSDAILQHRRVSVDARSDRSRLRIILHEDWNYLHTQGHDAFRSHTNLRGKG